MITAATVQIPVTASALKSIGLDFLTLRNSLGWTAERVYDKVVITKRPRRCYACLRKFDLGYSMRKQKFKYLQDIHSVYSCGTCEVLMEKFPDAFVDQTNGFFPTGCVKVIVENYNSPEKMQDFVAAGGAEVEEAKGPEELLEKFQIPGAMHYAKSNFNGSIHNPGHLPLNPTVINGYVPLNLSSYSLTASAATCFTII